MIAVMASALYLVRTQYESRSLTTEIDRATSLARNLETENDRLDVERRAQATPVRVEKLAREQLHMRTITPAITQYATIKAGAETSVAPVASAEVRP
jgi:cell division protein FtsL